MCSIAEGDIGGGELVVISAWHGVHLHHQVAVVVGLEDRQIIDR